MFELILLPLDGSQLAECVLSHSVAFARCFNSKITLLRIMEKNQTSASVQLFDSLNWQINKSKAALYLEKFRSRLQEAGTSAQMLVLEGLVAEGIIDYAQSRGIKLIILSSHGRHGLTQAGISSITQKVILGAQASILIVRAKHYGVAPGGTLEPMLYQRILVPLDGSQRAEHILPAITQLAHFHKSEVHLVQVVRAPEMPRQMPPAREDIDLSERVVARNLEEARHYLAQVKGRSYLQDLDVQTHLVTSDNAAIALHQLEEQENIDLVTMSAHGYSGNQQWPFGSMVHNFILYGKVPLLIVQDLPARQEPVSLDLLSRERIER
jgi:nucleotide-binding universal stress UspA family protein